jgi:cytochrome c
MDRRPGRSPWSAEKSSANMNDLRGGVARVKPKPGGGYEIPPGNLFPPGTPGTRPEVYVKGCRNVFRISVDPQTGHLYWGDVGPDAGEFKEGRGPAGHDEINQARGPGFFGWPYFVADNKGYWGWDFTTKTNGSRYVATNVVNASPFNTGVQRLPPAQPAMIYYAHAPSPRFPAVNGGGGRTAMAGPVHYFDPALASPTKLPAAYDRTLFIYEWSRNWIVAVKLTAEHKVGTMQRFCPKMTFLRPMDMELGPDGCLYVIEWGTNWADNKDTQIVRIEHAGGPAAP